MEIETSGLWKRYGSTLAVEDLSFTVRPGRVTGFAGPNGAGKSTTMRLILGLDAPDAGDARVGGRPYRAIRRPLREIGALLETAGFHPGRRARDHLLWLARSNDIDRRRVDAVLSIVGLESAAKRRVGGFSLGMKQRLGLAAALLGDPGVLMLDEPVNGLDPEGIRWIRGLLRGLAAEGRTVLVSSHLMSELEGTADHLIVIRKGKLIADAPVGEILAAAGDSRVAVRTQRAGPLMTVLANAGARVESSGDDRLTVTGLAVERIADLAAADAIPLYELTPARASLEDVFLEMTR
jgi:ABC-2 type transport system ATP-binding protein